MFVYWCYPGSESWSWQHVGYISRILVAIPAASQTSTVLHAKRVQDANNFVNELYKGVDPSKNRLADNLHSIGRRVLGKVLHLQQHLPAKIQVIQKEACQVRDVLGMRVVDYLGNSALSEEAIAFVQGSLTEILEQLFKRGSLVKLLKEVQECQKDFAGHQGGYEQSIGQKELEWRKRHSMLRTFDRLYTVVGWIDRSWVSPDVSFGIGAVLTFLGGRHAFAPAVRSWAYVGAAACSMIPAIKWWFFDGRTDFGCLEDETEQTLENIRDIKRMGYDIHRYYLELAEDTKRIMSHATKFQQLCQQLPFLQGRAVDVDSWDANKLSAALHDWNLDGCAVTFLDNSISGHAFLHVLREQDFRDMGITCELTLRRLNDMQARRQEDKQEILRCATIGPELRKAFEEVIDGTNDLKEKYKYK
ncbi:unnamed protein product [Symbiodinium pilosum]|uniref:SAM domain-containing protein n=1 Tax=Symbiodinium pilosum TaxID=2952 RepID=A0A812J766_SYMPI|nr:unnamed protein product [Symbiodinium pilosum]